MFSLKNYKKEITTKKGRKVLLRVPREKDVDQLMDYINALVEEDTFISNNKKVTRDEEEKYVKKRIRAIEKRKGFNILAEYEEEIIANGGVERLGMRREHVGELGITVAKEFRNEGLGTILIEELLRLSKEFLKLKLVYLYVFANNKRARNFYQKMGFKETGRIPKVILYKGKFIDQVFMWVDLDELNFR